MTELAERLKNTERAMERLKNEHQARYSWDEKKLMSQVSRLTLEKGADPKHIFQKFRFVKFKNKIFFQPTDPNYFSPE